MFARALSIALGVLGFRSILCFPSMAQPAVLEFLDLPNVTCEVEPAVFDTRIMVSGRSFLDLVRRYRPAIVHLHFMSFFSAMPWLARACGVKRFFFTDHGSRPETVGGGGLNWWKRLVKLAILHPINGVIAVSDYVLQSQIAMGHLPNKRFHLIHNGVDLERATAARHAAQSFRVRFRIPPDCVLITQVSWLIREKGVSDFVEAARMVLTACPRTHFCVVGTGPCLGEYTDAVEAAGLAEHFTFAGQVFDPFFDGVFVASDIICQPSRWHEAFGWVLAEAMAFGKPVVATRVGGIPEIVHDRVTGSLVARRDARELGRCLIELAADPALRERMGAAGLREVGERFALKQKIREHMILYGILTPSEVSQVRSEAAGIAAQSLAGNPGLPSGSET